MAFNKRNKRKITVGDQLYYWVAAGDDGWINLHVMVDVQGGQHLHAFFHYHQDRTDHGDGSSTLSNQFVITPYIVRQVIELGLRRGWTPLERGPELCLGHVDDEVDLRLDQNRVDEIKTRSSSRGESG